MESIFQRLPDIFRIYWNSMSNDIIKVPRATGSHQCNMAAGKPEVVDISKATPIHAALSQNSRLASYISASALIRRYKIQRSMNLSRPSQQSQHA